MYTVKPATNYSVQEFSKLDEARNYAESITDSTNCKTTVYDGDQYDGTAVCGFAWTAAEGKFEITV